MECGLTTTGILPDPLENETKPVWNNVAGDGILFFCESSVVETMKINHIRNIVVTIETTPEDLEKSITFSVFNPMFCQIKGLSSQLSLC